ncbi:MAG: hypothetical protein LBC02_03765 [Planctomycetaceae bacterium]|nr:hypothetical protein [Planctomycetaceae bacterium]
MFGWQLVLPTGWYQIAVRTLEQVGYRRRDGWVKALWRNIAYLLMIHMNSYQNQNRQFPSPTP